MPVLSTFPRLFCDIDNEPVSTAVMFDYVSRAAAELEEAKLQQKITDSLIEALGSLETKELRQIQLRSDVWGALDKPIQAIIDQSGGREPVARMLLVSALWRIINLLTSDEPLPVGKTKRQEERDVENRIASAVVSPEVAQKRAKMRDKQRRYRANIKAKLALVPDS
jgi:hypothetical protein